MMEILYCDNHILAAVKPFNVPTQADISGDADMLTLLKAWVKEKYAKPGNVFLGLVHRLDRPAGGVMVFARTSKAAARLQKQFASHAQGRKYLCVLRGRLEKKSEFTDWLVKGEDGFVRVCAGDAPGAKRALLVSAPLAYRDALTLADVELFTGRAHQIRVQHASRGLPLYGDNRYGGGKPGEQLALWAYSLTIEHPTTHEKMTFTAPPPDTGAWTFFKEEIKNVK